MEKMTRIVGLFLIALLAIAATHAEAVQMVGDFDIANVVGATVQWRTGDGALVTLGPSTALDFTPSAPLVNMQVTTASGDFAPFLGALGSIKDFTFVAGAGTAAFPEAPLAAWETITGGLTVDLTGITGIFKICPGCGVAGPACVGCSGVQGDNISLTIFGTVVFHHPLFEDTPGAFQFTSQGSTGRTE